MAFEHKEGQGSLFKNDKRTAENQPHARGDALIGGVLYEVAAWTKEGAKGKFQSLAFKPKIERAAENRRETAPSREELDDIIPF
jgi:hypothetical protein